jgi:DNA-binding PadR family transcriptional regulator
LRHHVHRRRIGVPKGLLRYLSLKLLQRQPMSGSEITEKIEEFTNWKPSPGSIYPLLANLQETDLIEPYTDADPGLKQFNITEKGKKEMEEMQRHPENIKARHISMRKLFWIMHRNMEEETFESLNQLLETIDASHLQIAKSDQQKQELKHILDTTAKAIKQLGVHQQ